MRFRVDQQNGATALCSVAVALLMTTKADAGQVRRPASASLPSVTTNSLPVDDLYRRKGYGMGGLTFGGGQGGTAQAGACADLAFANPPRCGGRGGYGIYGNGLGYGFGL